MDRIWIWIGLIQIRTSLLKEEQERVSCMERNTCEASSQKKTLGCWKIVSLSWSSLCWGQGEKHGGSNLSGLFGNVRMRMILTTLGGNEPWRAMATKTKAFFNCLIWHVSTEKYDNLEIRPNSFLTISSKLTTVRSEQIRRFLYCLTPAEMNPDEGGAGQAFV